MIENIKSFISEVKNEYKLSEIPFLNKQLDRVKTTQPYKNISILHNIPFTKETILKLEILYAGGANITVTSPSFMEADKTLVEKFINAGGTWRELHEIENETFDFHLDCAAELINRKKPNIGTVEITGTGTNKYGSIKANYPIISVDKSKVKSLEGVLGTGEAFVRAFEILSKENIENKNFMLFGYGKVGKGIVRYLKQKTNNIIIIDKLAANVEAAKKAGFESYLASDKQVIEDLASKMFAIVTATGIKDVISNNYNVSPFKKAYLANMGGEDEFGFGFTNNEVMCDKNPINFFIEKPTLMRYLDPVFYAHNLGIDLLLFANLNNGLHPFPEFISEEIVNSWIALFNETPNF